MRHSEQVAVKLATAVVFTALVCIATLVLTISVPATTGYFNVGETMIYTAALLFGPVVGAFAGGIGSAIADIFVAPIFAPATLIIKGCEGAIVGFLNKRITAKTSKSNWKIYTTLLGIVVGVALAITGAVYYSGYVELYVGIPPPQDPSLTGFVPAETWYFLGGITASLIILMGFRMEPTSGQAVFSVMAGGLQMVVGYFIYEQLILGKAALLEIPINIGQMLIGLIIAIPLVRIVQRRLPQLKS